MSLISAHVTWNYLAPATLLSTAAALTVQGTSIVNFLFRYTGAVKTYLLLLDTPWDVADVEVKGRLDYDSAALWWVEWGGRTFRIAVLPYCRIAL